MVRIKHRYLLLNILYPTADQNTRPGVPKQLSFHSPTPDYIDAGRFVGHLKSQISLLFGDHGVGVSASSLRVIYFSCATSTVILRVPRNHHRLVWAALTYFTELPGPRRGEAGRACVVRVVRVSGTIKKVEEELVRRARKEVVRAKLAGDGQGGNCFDGISAEVGAGAKGGGASTRDGMMDVEDMDSESGSESDGS